MAYSSNGNQLVVGTTAGTALLYEPTSRTSPVRVWHVAAAAPAEAAAAGRRQPSSGLIPVQVMWRSSSPAAAVKTGAAGTGGAGSANGSVLTMSDGVLCEWTTSGRSKEPVVAVDVLAAAAAALADKLSPAPEDEAVVPVEGSVSDIEDLVIRSQWQYSCAVSCDGRLLAVLAATTAAGALLLYEFGSLAAGSLQIGPQVLYKGSLLAGGGGVSWHRSGTVLIVASSSSSSSLVVNIHAHVEEA
jgi:hypothetical protein